MLLRNERRRNHSSSNHSNSSPLPHHNKHQLQLHLVQVLVEGFHQVNHPVADLAPEQSTVVLLAVTAQDLALVHILRIGTGLNLLLMMVEDHVQHHTLGMVAVLGPDHIIVVQRHVQDLVHTVAAVDHMIAIHVADHDLKITGDAAGVNLTTAAGGTITI